MQADYLSYQSIYTAWYRFVQLNNKKNELIKKDNLFVIIVAEPAGIGRATAADTVAWRWQWVPTSWRVAAGGPRGSSGSGEWRRPHHLPPDAAVAADVAVGAAADPHGHLRY